MKENKIIKHHARQMTKQNYAGLLRLALLLAIPGLLSASLKLVPGLAGVPLVLPLIKALLSLLVFPLQLGAARLLLFTFENDRLEGDVWQYYRCGRRGTMLLLWGISWVPGLAGSMLRPALEAAQAGSPPEWVLLLLGLLSLLLLAGMLWVFCRLLLCNYLFILDEDKPVRELVAQSLQRTAGYTGFILSFAIPLELLYFLCSMAVPGLLSVLLPAGSGWWWLLGPVLGIPVWPYVNLAMAGLASVLLPGEKERRKAEREKMKGQENTGKVK